MEPFHFRSRGRLIDFMRQADEPGLINLAAGVPGLDSLPLHALQEATARAFSRDGARMLAYHHPEGDHELRALLAERLRSRGAKLEGGQLVTTTGCTQALQVMLSILLQPGDIAACEAPAYYGMLEVLSGLGARILPIAIDGGNGVTPALVEENLARWKPRCLIVCSTLSNPSGATVPDAAREEIVESCRRHGVRLIEDDIYGELAEEGAPRSMLAWDPSGEVVSYVSSFSKTISPGLRAGVCAPGTLHESFASRKCQQDLHSGVVTESALREFLLVGSYDPHLEVLRARNRRRRELALKVIARTFPGAVSVLQPEGGYMLWIRLPEGVEMAKLQLSARTRGVVFAAGGVFFAGEAPGPCMRLNCAKAGEDELQLGLEILGALVSEQLAA